MITRIRIIEIFSIVLLLQAGQFARAEDSPDEKSLKFAEALFGDHDYYRAITEYKRFLFFNPDSARSAWVRFRIGQSYLEGGKLDAARHIFNELARLAPEARLKSWAMLANARAFYLQDRYAQVDQLLDDLLKKDISDELRSNTHYLLGCNRLKTGTFNDAKLAFEKVAYEHELAQPAAWLSQKMIEADDLPRKSPALAGILSLIPGLGHVYLGEYSIAITALMWNGLFGYATYDAFRRRNYGIGAVLATMELLWYSGTIYGAVSGADRFNRDARLNFFDELNNGAGLDIKFPDPAAVGGILMTGEF
ncbi:MAG: tetratricopeptide repeat protein [Deltaproteobacteria bacterium]|nr:tetratricopeptide repeat protein [Deltaproteobacteria bacterium]MBW1872482.1 tetratricopeptide repeat protein [Deltaproteobacteria bacterium]